MAKIEIAHGDLLRASVEALVNTVNTEGVMGKGIALQFRQAYPRMHDYYVAACKDKMVQLGKMHLYDLGALADGPRWIINFPTKGHWKSKSKLVDISAGLDDLIMVCKEYHIKSIAIPPLGCGLGGLKWGDVYPLIVSKLSNVDDLEVKLYTPSGAPKPEEMVKGTERPKMTDGRAALILMMQKYVDAMLDPYISLLEIHKLMYFLQEAGQPLRLQYKAKAYGPFADNLRQVLIKIDGHFVSGYGDGYDYPDKPMEILGNSYAEAAKFTEGNFQLSERMDRVAELITGFEDPYGLELLSSVHWVMHHDEKAMHSPESAISAVQCWNERKKKTLKPEHIRMAWKRIKTLRWDTESRSAVQ